jgi:hypothetical protein
VAGLKGTKCNVPSRYGLTKRKEIPLFERRIPRHSGIEGTSLLTTHTEMVTKILLSKLF